MDPDRTPGPRRGDSDLGGNSPFAAEDLTAGGVAILIDARRSRRG